VLAGDLLRGVAAGVDQPQREGVPRRGGRAHREHLVPGAGDAVGPGGVHVVGVLPDEVDVGRLVQAGAGGGVLVVVAEGQGPGDAAVLHRPHHVVQRLLRLQGGAGGAVDDVAVEEDDV